MERDRISTLKEQVAMLPLSPGCYLFSDSHGEVIYVGKAKSLRKRVSSYFLQSKDHTPKVRVMVRHIASLRYIVVDSETDALLLENSLIKNLQPRYNILLKDDKTYPWIVLRNEPFPRVQSTRQLIRDGSQYFGPYGSVAAQHAVLEFIREVLPLRTCRLNLASDMIARGKYSTCLQYHIGNCKAPCIGAQSEADYAAFVDMAVAVLKGDLRPAKAYLEGEMMRAAADLRFEAAQRFKARLEALEKYRGRSVIVSANIVDADVFSLLADESGDDAYCNFIRVRNGSIVAIQTVRISEGIDADARSMLTLGMQHVVENIAGELTGEVIVPFMPHAEFFPKARFVVPKRGDRKALLDFSERSARTFRAEQLKNLEIKNPERHTERIMEAMRRELQLDRQPRHIECFDNSNLQGSSPVASCVVFRDGKPSRKEYRHFNIKTVVGSDDYASMREVVCRRYTRLVAEGAELPDLIIADGGKGQMSAIHEVLVQLNLKIPIAGLAKDNHHRTSELLCGYPPVSIGLRPTSSLFHLFSHIQEEVHRFAITFHRQKRSNAFLHSELEGIDGIGEKSVNALLRHFRTMSKIRAASVEQIAEVIGRSRAEKIVGALHSADATTATKEAEPTNAATEETK